MRARLAPLAMLATLAACSNEPATDAPKNSAATTAADSYFTKEIAPVLQNACATCHLTGQEAGKMSLVPAKALASLVNVKSDEAPQLTRVVPGDPDASYLVMKLEGAHLAKGGTGARMPFGAPPLPPETIAKFRTWIKEGAKP